MIPSTIYMICAAGGFAILIFYQIIITLFMYFRRYVLFFIFKYFIHSIIIPRSRFTSPMTLWFLIFTILYWSGTAACNIIGVTTLLQASNRAGLLSVIKLAPLITFNRLGLGANILGLSLRTFQLIHSSVGIMAIIQASIHILLILKQITFNSINPVHFYGLLVSNSIIYIN